MATKLWPIAAILFLGACNSKNEDETDAVDKSGSVETAVFVEHADSTHDVVLTRHKVWVNYRFVPHYILAP